jgi:hypothetical protein
MRPAAAFQGLTHGRTPSSRAATIVAVMRAYTSCFGE